jgi:hypothetical protein
MASPVHFESLRRAILAHAGVAFLVTWEDDRTRLLVEALARSALPAPVPCYLWSVTEGLRRDGAPVDGAQDLAAALRHAVESQEVALYLFRDVVAFLDDPVVRRAVRDCFRTSRGTFRTVFLTGTALSLPVDLLKEVLVYELGLPATEEMAAIVDEQVTLHGPGTDLPADRRDALVLAARGLTLEEARIALRTAFLDQGPASEEAVAAVIDFKRQVILKLGVLRFVDDGVQEYEVGGLETLKAWLALRRSAFVGEAREHHMRSPKGLLVMGVPGCGKSMSVQMVAAMWGLPLLRLDLANVYSGAFGTPEASLHRALTVAEAVAPCVLWIDEIEKGIAGIKSSETGVVARVLGTFLTWMQEKTAPVFVAATANMIDLLPPEVLRKGRFDEVFFIDLPSVQEREAIWEIHLRRYDVRPKKFPPNDLAKMTAQYNGSEIEQVVVNATLLALAEHRPTTDHDLLVALGRTVPLAKTMSEKIQAVRNWAKDRAVPASLRSE